MQLGNFVTADEIEWIAPQSRGRGGISPDQAPQPRAPCMLVGKVETACVAALTLWKHRSQTQTAAQIA